MNRALDIEAVQECRRCVTLGKDHVPASGNPEAEIMIIGQSPGVNEVEQGIPFCGPSGEILDFFLDEANLTRDQVYITNALKCHPPGNRPGSSEELEVCFSRWLVKELKFVNPRIIVLVGKDAYKTVTHGKIPWGHGEITHGKNRVFMTVFHPAYFLRQGNVQDFAKMGKKLKELYEQTS